MTAVKVIDVFKVVAVVVKVYNRPNRHEGSSKINRLRRAAALKFVR